MSHILQISSKDNANVKAISLLQKSTKKRREEGVFVLEGVRLCLDALQNGFTPLKAFFSKTFLEKNEQIVYSFKSAEIYEVNDTVFTKMSDTVNPQGILCTFKIPFATDKIINPNGKYIALDNLQDPSNLGAVSRTAEAFAIDGLIVSGGCDPFSSKSLRASMGALLRIPVIETDNIVDLSLKYNLTTYASIVSKDAIKINEITFGEGSVVIIGNEANGVSNEVLDKADYKFTIPMTGRAESLNAAVAASIIIWEMTK